MSWRHSHVAVNYKLAVTVKVTIGLNPYDFPV